MPPGLYTLFSRRKGYLQLLFIVPVGPMAAFSLHEKMSGKGARGKDIPEFPLDYYSPYLLF